MITNSSQQWAALVLGGGDVNDTFAAAHGVHVKPLIPLADKPLAWYVLRALRESGRIDSIHYIGPTTSDLDVFIDQRLTSGATLLDNLRNGALALAEKVPKNTRILVCTADIPMLQAEEVRQFIDTLPNADFVYPIISRDVCETTYTAYADGIPLKRTYARLKEGEFSGGNIFACYPETIQQALPHLRKILQARKNPLQIARIIGWDILTKLLLGHLEITMLESKISELLELEAKAMITPIVSVGVDIDKEADLKLAQHIQQHMQQHMQKSSDQ